MIKTIIFDLDGTLINLKNDLFIKLYVEGIAKSYQKIRDFELVKKTVETSFSYMVKTVDKRLNLVKFYDKFNEILDLDGSQNQELEDYFLLNYYPSVKVAISKNENMIKALKVLKEKGYQIILATNPVFPRKATYQRIAWGGLDVEDFDYITLGDSFYSCKPQPRFYQELLEKLNLKPEECLMVGNDMLEDMVAATMKMKTYLITDDILNRDSVNFEPDHSSDSAKFLEYVNGLQNCDMKIK